MDGPPNFKGEESPKPRATIRGDGSGVDAVSQTVGRWNWNGASLLLKRRGFVGLKKGLDIFLYGNVMCEYGEGGYYIGCVQCGG
ncbi:MAG TPA: hypothetical protein VGO27_18655 [Candidatus Acidoferrum sp.]|nr:hypothetical protein [Candidatus Acidoferrum sp.]